MMAKKSWHDLSKRQKRGIGLVGAVQWSMTGAALLDIARRPPEQIQGRKIWWVLGSFVNFAGPISYYLFGRRR